MTENVFPWKALAWLLAALFWAFPPFLAAAAPPETGRAVVLETELASQDRDRLVFRGAVEISGPAKRPYQVYFQMRLNDGDFLKLPDDKNLVRMSKEITMPEDAPVARFTDCRVEVPLRDLESAVNLPHGLETVVWVDCSVWDLTAGRYITDDFSVSTPLLLTTDAAGKVVKVDADGVWAKMLRSKEQKTYELAMNVALTSAARARAALTVLVAELQESDEPLRRFAALDLGRILQKYPENAEAVTAALRKVLADDGDDWVRLYAAQGLKQAGKADEAIPVAARLLGRPEARSYAADLLKEIGRPAVPALRQVLGDKDAGPEAAVVLLNLGTDAKAAVAALFDALRKMRSVDPQESKLVAILENKFDAIGPNDAEAVPVLIDALKDSDVDFRGIAVRSLGRIGPDAAPAVDSLVETLKGDNAGLRWDAIIALARIGPKAKAAVPLLNDALADDDDAVRITVASALWSIDKSRPALAVLIAAAHDRHERARNQAVGALAAVGPDGKGAQQAIVQVLREDESRTNRFDAAFALRAFGARAVPDLVRALKEGPKEERNMILLAVGDMGAEAKDAVPAIREALQDDVPIVREAAAAALKKIDPEAARQAGLE